MTSDRKREANRINSRKSRGPRTAVGKAKASRNALRHGLAAIKYRDSVDTNDIDELAKTICDGDDDQELLNQARLIAAYEVVQRTIQAQQLAAFERQNYEEPEERDEHEALRKAAAALIKLERYERRAWSRQKRAIREFLAVKSAQCDPPANAMPTHEDCQEVESPDARSPLGTG